jgi:arsenate reductase-like glutaredoxin family protein
MIQIIGTRKCKDTQKALRFFKERRVEFHFVDLNERGLSAGELKSISQHIPEAELIDAESRQYQKRGLQYMKFDIMEELAEDPLLLKTPIVRTGQKAFIGYAPASWKSLIE